MMIWDLIKGCLMAFPIFILMGIIGNLIGVLSLAIFSKIGNYNINGFLKISIFISFIVGAVFFFIMGMFYASYTLYLTTNISKWFAVMFVSIFLVLISIYTFREVRNLHNKNILIASYDFFDNGKYRKHRQVVNENILLGSIVLFPSYILFLIFNDLANRLSLGLNSFLMSFFDG
jgi:hypothetical protein